MKTDPAPTLISSDYFHISLLINSLDPCADIYIAILAGAGTNGISLICMDNNKLQGDPDKYASVLLT